jgi:hypothetical protein
LPYPSEVLQLWGGEMQKVEIPTPTPPAVLKDDGSGAHEYAIIAVGAQGRRSPVSRATKAAGFARLRWDGVAGGDAYVVVRDGKNIAGPMRMEGAQKEWLDNVK